MENVMLHITRTQSFLIFVCGALSLPLLAIADGNHGGQICHAETAGGIALWAPCSSRRATCNDDAEQTCTIDGIDGNYRDAEEKAKDELASNMGDGDGGSATSNTIEKTTVKADSIGTGGNRATDYNSSRSNKADGKSKLDPDDDGDSIPTSGNRATDYNSSRSNKADGKAKQDSDGNEDETSKSIAGGDDCDDDCDSDVGANHNSTRSNKTKPVADDSGDADSDGDGDDSDADDDDEAQDYNSSRSNRG